MLVKSREVLVNLDWLNFLIHYKKNIEILTFLKICVPLPPNSISPTSRDQTTHWEINTQYGAVRICPHTLWYAPLQKADTNLPPHLSGLDLMTSSNR